MDWHVRLLGPDDAAAFQALRLEALARDPCAFAATPEEESGQSLAEIAARLAQQSVFGAFDGDTLLGVAGFAVPARAKKRHKGSLWGVYVCEAARGRRLGRALVTQVIEHARGHVVQLHAAVGTTNHAALGLHRMLGFTTYCLEPRGLACAGRYYDQELMVLILDSADSKGLGPRR
jgi:GNAT superfamily N-acetyltransferase